MSENKMITVTEIPGIVPHCETVLPNHKCPYIDHGCTGCEITFEKLQRQYISRSLPSKKHVK
jgi:hypothetical protein